LSAYELLCLVMDDSGWFWVVPVFSNTVPETL